MTQRDTSALTRKRPRRRLTSRRIMISVLVVVILTGGIFTALVQFGGYCRSNFFPVDSEVSSSPYVQNVSSNAATIMWRTENEVDGRVAFGRNGDLNRVVTGEITEVHAVRITDLEPDTAYTYQAQSPERTYEQSSFRTAPGPEGEVTAIVVGDTGSGSEVQMEIADVMQSMNADLILHTGDVVYKRGAACHYESRFYEPYEELIDSVPVYPVLGNHDVLTDNGEPFLNAFQLPAESSGTERYYSFDFGPLHVAALDSELYYEDESIPVEEQKEWLRQDLASTDRPWKVVVIHRPPYSSSPYHGGDRRILEDLVSIFKEEGVDVVFGGHEHVYERLKPINGVTYFVTGGGGGDLRGAGRSELTAVSLLQHHALRVEANPDRILVEAVGIDGEVLDSIELTEPSD